MGVYQLIVQVYCPSSPIARRRIIIIMVIWVCRNICTSVVRGAQNLVKDFRNVHPTYVTIEHRIVPSYINGFPGLSENLLPVLVYDSKLRKISFRWLWVISCSKIVLVDEVLCSLTLLSMHLLDSPKKQLQFSSGQVH